MAQSNSKLVLATENYDNIIEKIKLSAKAQKRVSRVDDLDDQIVKIFNYIKYFNTLDQDSTLVFPDDPKTLDRIPILKEFSEFILPSSVKLIAGNRRMEELLVYWDSSKVDKSLSYSDYLNVIDTFRGYFKKDASNDIVTLDSLKKELSLSDVLSRLQLDDSVNYDSDPFIPIKLNQDVRILIGTKFMQDSAEKMIEDYCAKIRF